MQPGTDFAKDLASQEGRTFDRQLMEIERAGEELIADLSFNQANWSPSTSGWSIAQCLTHISVSARLYLVSIDQSIRKGRHAGLIGRGPFVYGPIGRWLVRNIEPPPRLKIKTGRKYAPASGRPVGEVLSEFVDMHEKVQQ